MDELKVAIVGGTGDLGKGLGVRLSSHYEVLIGSRDAAKAERAAAEVEGVAGGTVSGHSNAHAVSVCDIAILAIPDLPTTEMLAELAEPLRGKLVISPIVPMRFQDGLFSYTLNEGSAAEKVASALQSRVVSAFHTVPAERLLKLEDTLGLDVLVAADSRESYSEAADLVLKMGGLRPLYAGPLKVSRMIESMTPLLLNIGRFSKMRSPSIRVV